MMATPHRKEFELRDIDRLDIDEVLAKGNLLISARTGIIKKIERHVIDQSDIPLVYYFTELADVSRYWEATKVYPSKNNVGGSVDWRKARAAAVGESVERYCGSIAGEAELIFSNYSDLKEDATPPEAFVLFSQEQYERKDFPFHRFTAHTKVRWVQGYSLIKSQPILVPACFVYVPYQLLPGEALICQPTSNGLACGDTLEEAILHGLYEVVERDAFMTAWYRGLPVPRLVASARKNEVTGEMVKRCESLGMRVFFLDITPDLKIPAVLTCFQQAEGPGPAAAVGAASRLNLEEALLKSLEEAALTRFWVRRMMMENPSNPFGMDFNKIKDFSHHPLLYGYGEMLPCLRFLFEPQSLVTVEKGLHLSTGRVLGDLKLCLQMLSRASFDVVMVDLTTPDIKEIGFYVVRVVIPGLHPIDVQYQYRYLSDERMRRGTGELNPYPHPFP